MNVVHRYQSVAELSAALRTEKIHSAWKNNLNSIFARRKGRNLKQWCGETPEDAIRKLDTGDADLASKIKAEGDILNTANGGHRPRIEMGVYGCIPSVPNYLRGVPANMMRVVREPRRNPVVDIYVENSIYDGIDTDMVAKKAAIVANVITASEMAGVRVNLYAVNASYDSDTGRRFCCITKVKDATAPLNLLNISFPICNRAMCRSIFLMWLERHSDTAIDGYGHTMIGVDVKRAFNLDGVVLSIRDMVERDYGVDDVTKRVNEYLNGM